MSQLLHNASLLLLLCFNKTTEFCILYNNSLIINYNYAHY